MTYGELRTKCALERTYMLVRDDAPLEDLVKHIEWRIKGLSSSKSKLSIVAIKSLKNDLNVIKQYMEEQC